MSEKNNSKNLINRRMFLKRTSLNIAGAGLFLKSDLLTKIVREKDAPKMKYRVLGRTGVKLSEISLGGHYNGPDWKKKGSGNQSRRNAIVKEAYKSGINFLDLNYDYEREQFGVALKAAGISRDKIYISTDVNSSWETAKETKENVIKQFNEQLKMLKIDYADQFRFTTIANPYNNAQLDGSIEAFEILKKQGKVRFLAYSNHYPENLLRAMDEYKEFDAIYVPYNYTIQGAAKEVFPKAKEKNIGVIVIKPFSKGIFFRIKEIDTLHINEDLRKRMKASGKNPKDVISKDCKSLAAANLRFILQNKNVTTIVPGMESIEEVQENVSASTGGKLTDEDVGLLRRYWYSRGGKELTSNLFSGKYKFLHHWKG